MRKNKLTVNKIKINKINSTIYKTLLSNIDENLLTTFSQIPWFISLYIKTSDGIVKWSDDSM